MVKTLESPLDSKEIQPVHPKGKQSWIFTGRTDVEAETLILWPPDANSWLIRKDPDAGKDWRQEEKGMTEVEIVGWHHQLNRREFEQAPGVGDGRGTWHAVVHGVAKSCTWLSDWTELKSACLANAWNTYRTWSPSSSPLLFVVVSNLLRLYLSHEVDRKRLNGQRSLVEASIHY